MRTHSSVTIVKGKQKRIKFHWYSVVVGTGTANSVGGVESRAGPGDALNVKIEISALFAGDYNRRE